MICATLFFYFCHMNFFKFYLESLNSKWYVSLKKWIDKTGQIRVVLALFLICAAFVIYMYDKLFNGVIQEGIVYPNWTWKDDLLFYGYYLIALPLLALNGIAWVISGFKFNIIFIIELFLLAVFIYLYHPNAVDNIEIIPLSLVALGVVVLLLPSQSKQAKHRSSRNSRHRSSRHRSRSQRSKGEETITE